MIIAARGQIIYKIYITGDQMSSRSALIKLYCSCISDLLNSLTAKLFGWNFHPFEIVSR